MKRDMPRFMRNLPIWLVFFNWPPIAILIPPFRLIAFLPYLFWINLPGLRLAALLGPPHFEFGKFGAFPHGPLAWGLIGGFWFLIAICFALATEPINRLLRRNKGSQTEAR